MHQNKRAQKLTLYFFIFSLFIGKSLGQTCTGSTPANPGARTGNLYTTATINPGNTSTVHWFQGTATGATITMSGTSTLIIKTGSNLTLAGALTIASGCIIYVESGANFTIAGNLVTNGRLINLGNVVINGYLSLASGAVYNDSDLTSTSYLWISSSTFTFLNGGTASFSHVYFQVGTGSSPICLRPGSVFNMVSNSGSTISGTGALPTGGLFQYNATDISNNTACTPPNPARINYYDGYVPANAFLWGPSGTVANNANITIVGSTPTSSNTGSCTIYNGGTGYVASAPQNFNLPGFSPVPSVIGNYFLYCLNSSVSLSSMASGTNLLWYTSATGGVGSSTTPTVNTSSAGLQTFWVNQNVTASCEGPRTPINIDVSSTAATSAITASNNGPKCINQTLTLTGGGTGITSWSWTGPNNYSSSTQSPTVSASTTTAMSGTYLLMATQTSGSCLNSASTTVVVNGAIPVQPGAFLTSSTPVCQGQTGVSYSVPISSDANSYLWTYTTGTGVTINNGTTNSVSVDFSTSATSGTINVYGVNACGNSTSPTNMGVFVNAGIAQPGAFTTSTTTICPGQANVTYTVPAVSGATSYNWSYSGTGATISGSTNSVTISFSNVATSGTLSVSAVSASCGAGTARTLAITVSNLYQIPTTGLIAHYQLNGNANDFISNNAGTLQNAPTSTNDRFGIANTAYSLNGTNQFISTANSYSNPANFTLSIWFNTTTTTGGKLIGFGDSQTGTSGSYDRHIYMNDAGQLYFGVYPGTVKTINSTTSYNDGAWHMVTASLSATNGMKLYVDGVLIASDATTTSGQAYTGYWKIGFDNTGGWTQGPSSNYFNGKVDDVLIYGTELTAGQISGIYSSPYGISCNSPICNGGTLNLTAITISGATYSWTGPNSFSSSSQNPSVTNMSAAKEGVYAVTVTLGSCSQTVYTIARIDENLGPAISLVPSSGLLSQYKLNGNANDVTGTNPGTLQSNPSSTSDRFGVSNKAYTFNGTSQYISTSVAYNNPSDFSVSVWFKTTVANNGVLIGFGNVQTGTPSLYDRYIWMNGGKVSFYTGATSIQSLSTFNDGNWHLATATMSSVNGMNLYIDGMSVASSSNIVSQNYTGWWTIGYSNSSYYFSGNIDDVLIYNRALSNAEATALFNSSGDANNTGPVCIGTTVNLSAATIGGATYSWTGPNSFSSSSQNPSLTFTTSAAGTYSVSVSQGGCTSTGYTSINTNTSTPGQWTGYSSTNWATASNWCGGAVPTSTTDVTIPAVATLPINSGTANINNLTISSSATLTNSGTFNIYGNFTGAGATSYIDEGLTAFVGSSSQTVTNVDSMHSVTVNNASGVTLATPTYVKGYLTLTAGTLASGGNLTVDLNTGNITGAGTGTISGNITVLKWVWSDKWHYISSPLSGRTVADWNDDVTIKFGANSNLYLYDETVPNTSKDVGWTAITTTATAIQDMRGYALYFPRGIYKTTVDLTGTYNHAQTYSNAALTNTISGTAASDGWNLVGNPYPSVIDWDATSGWTKTGLNDAIYCWDEKNLRYASYVAGVGTNGGTRYIPAMQGFYVVVNTPGGTGTLGMDNNVRTTAANPDVWRIASEDKIIKLSITNPNYTDETIVRFKDNASEKFDAQLDAYKIINGGSAPSLSTKLANNNYSINSIPSNLVSKIIPLITNIETSGTYTINSNITGFSSVDNIVLEDRLLNIFQNLKTTPTYSAELVNGDTTTRFFLHYSNKRSPDVSTQNTNTNDTQVGLTIYAYKQIVTINFNDTNVETAKVMIYNAVGTKIFDLENANVTSGRIECQLPNVNNGIYIVKVQSNAGIETQQVYIHQ